MRTRENVVHGKYLDYHKSEEIQLWIKIGAVVAATREHILSIASSQRKRERDKEAQLARDADSFQI